MNTKRKDNIYFTSIVKALKKTRTKEEVRDEISRFVEQVNLSEDKESYLISKEYSFVFDLKQWEEFYNTVTGNKKINSDRINGKKKEILKEKEIVPQSNFMIPSELSGLAATMLLSKRRRK